MVLLRTIKSSSLYGGGRFSLSLPYGGGRFSLSLPYGGGRFSLSFLLEVEDFPYGSRWKISLLPQACQISLIRSISHTPLTPLC